MNTAAEVLVAKLAGRCANGLERGQGTNLHAIHRQGSMRGSARPPFRRLDRLRIASCDLPSLPTRPRAWQRRCRMSAEEIIAEATAVLFRRVLVICGTAGFLLGVAVGFGSRAVLS